LKNNHFFIRSITGLTGIYVYSVQVVRAYFRQDLPVVMDAHIRAHDAFGGLCECGIYDNPKTIVTRIGSGKARDFNPKFLQFLQLSSRYLFEIRACSRRSDWEKGQVERQVGVNRTI
jgi:transposase